MNENDTFQAWMRVDAILEKCSQQQTKLLGVTKKEFKKMIRQEKQKTFLFF